MEWKYESIDTVMHLSLHDCECSRIYNENNNLVMLMEWMEVLETHPDNPYSEAHQSGNGMIELLECEIIHLEHNIGEEKILIESLNEIDFYEFEVLDFDIEKVQSNYRAKIYMLKTRPQKQFEDISIELLFKKSRTKFNELNDVSWFVDFNNGKVERNSQLNLSIDSNITISTYEELHSALLSLDNKHIMYKKDDACFCIKLDEEYDITIYNNRDGEVYLEYNAKGKQLTHYHPDYWEAYEDLAYVIRNPEKELERLKKDTAASKRAAYGWVATILILIALSLVVAWLFGGGK